MFDRLMLAFVHAAVSAPALVAALMLYSLVYYIPAYVMGSAMFAACEARVRWRRASAVTKASVRIVAWPRVVARSVVRLAPEATPLVVGVATSAGGLVLLVSGATPSVTSRVEWLADVLPLGVIEMSHFAASMAGVVLMLLGWALTRRLAAAYAAAIVMTALGIAASLLKGLDWEEAASLGIVLLLLAANRSAFHRRSALGDACRSWRGVVAALGGVASTVWLVLFSSRHLEYSHQLWWRFTLDGDAPGALRAAVGGVAAMMAMSVTQLLRSRSATPAPPTDDELSRAARLVRASPDVAAAIALLGDKRLLFAPDDRAFLMYGVQGDSWIALGDPVGEAAAAVEVAWRFREHAHRAGARPAFYQVSAEQLPLLIDLGMSVHKIGESASVPLDTFSLEGGMRKGLRRSHRDIARQGVTFEVVPECQVPDLLPELRGVSNDWLRQKSTREKGFSLGRFDEAYLRRYPIAMVRRNGAIVAFANVWLSAGRAAMSIDLMRYSDVAPRGVMDFLLVELMQWGRREGYQRFDLGMAPLSGLAYRRLAPLWTVFGALLFKHGEPFYNFRGVRHYKEKFDPVWSPRYVACAGRFDLPRVMADVATLVAGGVRGIFGR